MFSEIQDAIIPYLKWIGIPEDWFKEIEFWVVLTSGIALPILISVFKSLKWIVLNYKMRILNRDLHPWYTPAEIDSATRYYIPSRYQNISPSQDEEPGRRYIATARNPMIPLFINKVFNKTGDENRFYIVLADSGMGKSTFMINGRKSDLSPI